MTTKLRNQIRAAILSVVMENCSSSKAEAVGPLLDEFASQANCNELRNQLNLYALTMEESRKLNQ